jgi:uncharacterized membrane protein
MNLLASSRAFFIASLSLTLSGLALALAPIKIGEINSYSAIPQFTQSLRAMMPVNLKKPCAMRSS